MAESKNITTYRTVVEEAFSKGNLSVLDRVIATNMKEHEIGVDQSGGIQGLRNSIQMFRTAFPDLKMTIQDVWETGDIVVARLRCTGTQKGPLGDIQPTGKKADVECIDICRMSGEKISEHWGITDRLTMMEQLGVVPQMAHN
jgi:predicted ester cyclase